MHLMVYVRIILTTLTTITCLMGDNFVELAQHPLLKALADNGTHAAIGALTGIAFAMQLYDKITNVFGWVLILICFVISSFIDLDHFVEARSWHLEDATSLSHRPFLHCSSIVIVLLVLFMCISFLNYFHASLILGVLLCAFITHHTRDAVRRGYWFCPFGYTDRLPYWAYIMGTLITPYAVLHLYNFCHSAPVQQFLGQYIQLQDKYRAGGYRLLDV